MAATVEDGDVHVHSAETVGNAFATQYYLILQRSPELVYRFYKDMSQITRIDSDSGIMASTTTMDGINEKILSHGSLKADIKFVDAQESLNGGVIVLINGSMVNEDDSRRTFTQTFFLAPQTEGYYVLNDILRYVDDGDPNDNEQDGDVPPVTSSQEPPPMAENHISEKSNGEVCSSSGELPDQVVEEKLQVEEKFEDKEPVAGVVVEAPQEPLVTVASIAKVEGPPKKSYASIVMKDTSATMPSSIPPKSVSKVQGHQVPVVPAPTTVAVNPSSNMKTVEDAHNEDLQGEGPSIYARNLPMNVPFSVVEQVFQKFGPLRTNGIQIRHNNRVPFWPYNYRYAFVEFETAAAAQSAIEASPIFIEGHKVVIEEKRSTATRENPYGGNYRGRYYPGGRGNSSFRGEGGRGPGGYGGDTGYGGRGRGEGDNSDFGGRGGGGDGGGGGCQTCNEGYQRSDQTRNGSGGRGGRGGGGGGGGGGYQTRNEGYKNGHDETVNGSEHMNRGGGSSHGHGGGGRGYQKIEPKPNGARTGRMKRGGGPSHVPTRPQKVAA